VLRGKVTVLEGEWQPKRCVILEFSSAADAQQWWNSPDYAEAAERDDIDDRRRGSLRLNCAGA